MLETLRRSYKNKSAIPLNLQLRGNGLTFQPVSGLESIRYVHAALWQGDNVRITVVRRQGKLDDILCVLWYSADQSSNFTIVRALVKDLQSYGFGHPCAYIKCFLDGKEGDKTLKAPAYVGLINEKSPLAQHRILLPVENRDMDPDKVNREITADLNTIGSVDSGKKPAKNRVVEFTVCIPTMFRYRKAAQLVEKLEMVRLLGAGRVVLYDTSAGSNVRSVVKFYTREWAEGRETLEVVVHSWRPPSLYIHYNGQVAAVDDCLHRYGWLSKYMVFDDLDELIVPLRHENWSQLIAERERLRPGNAAFMFRNVFVHIDHFSPQEGLGAGAQQFGSSVLGFTYRDNYIYWAIRRSKLILNPRKIESIGVHHVYEGYGPTDVIPEDQGLLYHFRMPQHKKPCGWEVQDSRLSMKFGKRLLARLKSIWSKLPGVSLGYAMPSSNRTRTNCIEESEGVKETIRNKRIRPKKIGPKKWHRRYHQ